MKTIEEFWFDDFFSRVDDGELIYFHLKDDGTFERVEQPDDQDDHDDD